MLLFIREPSDILVIRKLHSILQDPSVETIEVLRKQCDEKMSYKVKDALTAFVSQVRLPSPASPNVPTWLKVVSTAYEGPHTHTTPGRFQLGVWVCNAGSWRNLARYTCEILHLEHAEVFTERAFTVTGPRRDYFSTDRSTLRDPYRVGEIFVETNLSANNCVSFVNRLAEAFGYDRPVINPQV